jgi:hypothetical protein
MTTLTQTENYIKKEYGWLVGKTVELVRPMKREEVEQFGWYEGSEVPFVIFFTDGSYIIPMQDDEGNGPGALAHSNEGK